LSKLQQQDIALAKAQASLGTNAAAISRPAVPNLNTEMLTANVPANPVPPVELPKTQKKIEIYEIQSGDTFAKLARRYNVKPDDLIKLNPDANPNNLKIGQEIKIPVQ
ncbi:MAG: LysM peptidoglycan-binding domain-containing protein, partial [Verrucomicrobia bacterium]|nr:LysM peptidoglycan-binding domain-containing protein [Verrucomicrobiota bacterium]